ncbi:hypothetical protein [Pseudarthrobacter sp. BIM B-2242]|uniref:hypothetical protein n=1 Tax=Pseudarthrobacter sp. BIM B-2242 TaxID=2772401 RepID=UPI00168ACCE4|nr:hypothetical protein [Pseudarthrobacter sp. BIM B-2242]QOD05639.1 hypothetical protein IDT60_04665 [Pseudarthrobacter sp. BIM B-2242]
MQQHSLALRPESFDGGCRLPEDKAACVVSSLAAESTTQKVEWSSGATPGTLRVPSAQSETTASMPNSGHALK